MAKKAAAAKKSAATVAKVDFTAMTDADINTYAAQSAVPLWDPETGNARSRDELIAAIQEAQKTVKATS